MTEKEKMLAGMLYNSGDAELIELRLRAHGLSKDYNELYDRYTKRRDAVLRELLGTLPPNLFLQGPVQFDYGLFTTFGKDCYANFNFVVLDCCPVTIGEDCVIGAGSVVTRDIPANSFAAGNPCRVIKPIDND